MPRTPTQSPSDTPRTVMRMPEEAPAILELPPVTAKPRLPNDCLPIEDAPDDGKAVLLTDGLQYVPGRIKHVRIWDPRGGKARYVGKWVRRLAEGGGSLGFEPIGFKAIPNNYGFESPK